MVSLEEITKDAILLKTRTPARFDQSELLLSQLKKDKLLREKYLRAKSSRNTLMYQKLSTMKNYLSQQEESVLSDCYETLHHILKSSPTSLAECDSMSVAVDKIQQVTMYLPPNKRLQNTIYQANEEVQNYERNISQQVQYEKEKPLRMLKSIQQKIVQTITHNTKKYVTSKYGFYISPKNMFSFKSVLLMSCLFLSISTCEGVVSEKESNTVYSLP